MVLSGIFITKAFQRAIVPKNDSDQTEWQAFLQVICKVVRVWLKMATESFFFPIFAISMKD